MNNRGPFFTPTLTIGIPFIVATTGCAFEPVEDGSVQSLTQEATIYICASPENFCDSPGEVSVCFIAPTSEGTVGDADMAEIEGCVKQYWQPAMGLDIRFRGHCVVHSPVPSDWITAYVNWGAASTGNGVARFGVGRRLSPEARFEDRTDVQIYLGAPHSRYNVLHEFGHAFGLEHEFQRSDRDFSCLFWQRPEQRGGAT